MTYVVAFISNVFYQYILGVMVMVFIATFNNISVIWFQNIWSFIWRKGQYMRTVVYVLLRVSLTIYQIFLASFSIKLIICNFVSRFMKFGTFYQLRSYQHTYKKKDETGDGSTIPLIHVSTDQTITSHLTSLNIKNTMTYESGNPCPGLEQAQKCGRVKMFIYNSIEENI